MFLEDEIKLLAGDRASSPNSPRTSANEDVRVLPSLWFYYYVTFTLPAYLWSCQNEFFTLMSARNFLIKRLRGREISKSCPFSSSTPPLSIKVWPLLPYLKKSLTLARKSFAQLVCSLERQKIKRKRRKLRSSENSELFQNEMNSIFVYTWSGRTKMPQEMMHWRSLKGSQECINWN